MRKSKSLSAGCVVLIFCLIVLGFSSLIQGSNYKVKPEITLPEYFIWSQIYIILEARIRREEGMNINTDPIDINSIGRNLNLMQHINLMKALLLSGMAQVKPDLEGISI